MFFFLEKEFCFPVWNFPHAGLVAKKGYREILILESVEPEKLLKSRAFGHKIDRSESLETKYVNKMYWSVRAIQTTRYFFECQGESDVGIWMDLSMFNR